VERELILRLASLLWRLRRATTIETGLLQIQADNLHEFRKARDLDIDTQQLLYGVFVSPRSVPLTTMKRQKRRDSQTDPPLSKAVSTSVRQNR
jgi:hypothetical protein